MDKEYINRLLRLYFTDVATHKEREALFEELQNNYEEADWEEILVQLLAETQPEENYNADYWQQRINDIVKLKAKVVPLRPRRTWHRIAIAAVVMGLLIGSYFLFFEKEKPSIAKTPAPIQKDIEPGTEGAILTLSNGKQIILDSAKGNIASEGGVAVINKDGSVSYSRSALGESGEEMVYNTIITPRARQYQLTLQDGTKIWLNAESSIRFPTAFTGSERVVEISGEAYFEVAHNAAKPFIVSIPHSRGQGGGGMQIEVLGTHFNVNSYADETSIKTTLLEGKVRVTRNGNIVVLKPGQQALASDNNQLTIDNNPDLDAVMAWKNGMFLLDNTDLSAIMRQISRWYDVDVAFKGEISSKKFGGGVSKTLPLSKVLELLEVNGVKTKLEGKKLTVLE